jgi:hypothetical protein
MGKGGEKSVAGKGPVQYKLAGLETAVLRKWAKAYNIDPKIDERNTLLKELVSFKTAFTIYSILTIASVFRIHMLMVFWTLTVQQPIFH